MAGNSGNSGKTAARRSAANPLEAEAEGRLAPAGAAMTSCAVGRRLKKPAKADSARRAAIAASPARLFTASATEGPAKVVTRAKRVSVVIVPVRLNPDSVRRK